MYFWADTPDGVEFGVHGVEKDPAALAVLPALAREAAGSSSRSSEPVEPS